MRVLVKRKSDRAAIPCLAVRVPIAEAGWNLPYGLEGPMSGRGGIAAADMDCRKAPD